ncbi:hypothetical protein G7B40_034500 [Aetokthonos hydrillicola Thurmond2011]|uniref:Secreted protein n=1 Tax=Aetokthonos hydrillicola Thurmond2011 TaxID=2712845 RepID=A0AAP5IEF9_9CYAN|nr:hypothetical protein [Aetokthonos hydrillicola]MDR9899632.1 hypothetical protein [Aetokthonos hydrillicola Thurmond2011]
MLKKNYILFGLLTTALTIAPVAAQAQQQGGSTFGKILQAAPDIINGINTLRGQGNQGNQNNNVQQNQQTNQQNLTSQNGSAPQQDQQSNQQNPTNPNNFCGVSGQLQVSVQNLNPAAVASDLGNSITNLVQGKQTNPNQLNTSGNIGCSK